MLYISVTGDHLVGTYQLVPTQEEIFLQLKVDLQIQPRKLSVMVTKFCWLTGQNLLLPNYSYARYLSENNSLTFLNKNKYTVVSTEKH